MNELLQALSRFFSSWKCWVVVAPWEIGVRVRLGHISKGLGPGPHFRIPLLDQVTLVNTRLRISTAPSVTISAAGPAARANGKVRTIAAVMGYRIVDPNLAMLRYSHPDSAVLSLAQAEIARGAAAEAVLQNLNAAFGEHGIEIEFVRYVEDVEAKAYRILDGKQWGFTHDINVPAPTAEARY